MAAAVDRKTRFPLEDAVEVVDAGGRPLAVLPACEAHRQSLPHKAVQVLFQEATGKLLLEKRSPGSAAFPGRWDLAARDHIRPGESSHDAARRLADDSYHGQAGQVAFLKLLGPGTGTGFEALSVYRCRISGPAEASGREVLAVNRGELEVLIQEFRELLTPEVVHAFEAGILFTP